MENNIKVDFYWLERRIKMSEIAGLGEYWIGQYRQLKRINDVLEEENAKLKEEIEKLRFQISKYETK